MNRRMTGLLGGIGCASALSLVVVLGAGCSNKDDKGNTALAPTSSALAPTKAASTGSMKFAVDKTGSKIDFAMEAPKEKIHGKATDATSGDLQLDLDDVTRSTGVVTIDISGLEIFQAVTDKDGKFAEESKSEAQNKHARTWLEISDDAPEDMRKQNAKVQFSIKSIEAVGEKSPAKLTGADRLVKLKIKGDFLLHGHKAEKTAEVDATFHYAGDKPASVSIKTTKPIPVDLAEHDVKPRDAFGRFAAKTLDALAPKVNKEASVSIEFTAKLAGTTSGMAPVMPAATGTMPAKAP